MSLLFRSSTNNSPLKYRTQQNQPYQSSMSNHRSELVEFRNYIRNNEYAKLDLDSQPQKKLTSSQHISARPLLSIQQKNFDTQTQNSARYISPFKTQQSSFINRSSSQVEFDSNVWKENKNSFNRDIPRVNTGQLHVQDLLKIATKLSSLSDKEIKSLNSSYLLSLQELQSTIGQYIRRIDNNKFI
ncbi:hypothetical protein pb186bvf_008122 [Paramecium bursaria]